MSNSCCISSAKKTFFVKDLHIFEALKMIYNSPNRPEKLYRLPYEYKKSKKMLKSCRAQLGQAYWSLFPPRMGYQSIARLPPSISSGFPDDPPVPIYTPERREERALPKNKTQWPGQVLNSTLPGRPGGLERGEAETGSVNKPAVKFGLEIEPLGHSDAMGEGRGREGGSSDNVLSILHHKFSSWSWGGGEGGFWLFQIESLPDPPWSSGVFLRSPLLPVMVPTFPISPENQMISFPPPLPPKKKPPDPSPLQ